MKKVKKVKKKVKKKKKKSSQNVYLKGVILEEKYHIKNYHNQKTNKSTSIKNQKGFVKYNILLC